MKKFRFKVRNKAEYYLAIQWLKDNGYHFDHAREYKNYHFVHGEETGDILTCQGECKLCKGPQSCVEITPIVSFLRLEKLERLRENF